MEREAPWPLAEVQDHGRLSSRFDLATWHKDGGGLLRPLKTCGQPAPTPFARRWGSRISWIRPHPQRRLRPSVCFGSVSALVEQGARSVAGGLAGGLCHWERSTGRDSHAPAHWEMESLKWAKSICY